MDITAQTVLSQNITLLYDSVNVQVIDSGKLKELAGIPSKPMLMDTSDMIVAVYPPYPVIIQIRDRRISITLQQHGEDIGGIPLWGVAVECNQLVPKSTLLAYGFNYDVGVEFDEGNANSVIIRLFVSNPQRIEGLITGQLLSSIPRFKFRRGEVLYDLVLEPVEERRVIVHLNAHFAHEGIALPSQDQLRTSFYDEYRYLTSILPGLFEGEA